MYKIKRVDSDRKGLSYLPRFANHAMKSGATTQAFPDMSTNDFAS